MTITRELQRATIKAFAHESETQNGLVTNGGILLDADDDRGYDYLSYGRAAYDYVVDEYGQFMYSTAPRTADIAFKVYAQQNVQDPRYVDVEAIGLTKDTSIVPGEVVCLAQGDFRVKYVIPTGRWQQLMLVRL